MSLLLVGLNFKFQYPDFCRIKIFFKDNFVSFVAIIISGFFLHLSTQILLSLLSSISFKFVF